MLRAYLPSPWDFPVKVLSAARGICGPVNAFTHSVADLDILKVAGIYIYSIIWHHVPNKDLGYCLPHVLWGNIPLGFLNPFSFFQPS
jgi:hypothetical protein